jgi:agmatinase
MKLKYLTQEEGFLGIKDNYLSSIDEAKAVIIPFGLESSVSYEGGTKNGPYAIIEASKQVELFDEEFWIEPYEKYGVATLEKFKIDDNLEKSLLQIEKINEQLLNNNKFPLTIGGEHSITAGAIRPFIKKYQDLAILHFDAHADLRDGYEGQYYSHAAALRRVMDQDISTLISCGIRNISKEEISYLQDNENRIKIYFAKDKKKWSIDEMIKPLKNRPVYITFDLDGFDSSLMQATGTPEPGGLMWDEAIEIIKKASEICNIVGADVVELAPIKGFHSCDFLAAKLCYKILNYALINKS